MLIKTIKIPLPELFPANSAEFQPIISITAQHYASRRPNQHQFIKFPTQTNNPKPILEKIFADAKIPLSEGRFALQNRPLEP